MVFHGSAQDTQLDLDHIEPTAMLRCVMELQLLENASGFFWWKDLIKSSRFMRRQIIQHHSDDCSQWIQIIHQPLHAVRKILHRVLLGHTDVAFGLQRLKDHMQISYAMPPILIVHSFALTRSEERRVGKECRSR